jgi:hypothetical protein
LYLLARTHFKHQTIAKLKVGKFMNLILANNRRIPRLSVAATSAKLFRRVTNRTHKWQLDPLQPVRKKLDGIEVHDQKFARFLYKAIPSQCPFERDIAFFGHKVAHIPPLCKLNPLYEQLVGLRFRALCYLVDECGVDLQSYS